RRLIGHEQNETINTSVPLQNVANGRRQNWERDVRCDFVGSPVFFQQFKQRGTVGTRRKPRPRLIVNVTGSYVGKKDDRHARLLSICEASSKRNPNVSIRRVQMNRQAYGHGQGESGLHDTRVSRKNVSDQPTVHRSRRTGRTECRAGLQKQKSPFKWSGTTHVSSCRSPFQTKAIPPVCRVLPRRNE